MGVQAFVAQAAVEAFDVAVFNRAAGPDEVQLHAVAVGLRARPGSEAKVVGWRALGERLFRQRGGPARQRTGDRGLCAGAGRAECVSSVAQGATGVAWINASGLAPRIFTTARVPMKNAKD